MASFIKPVPVSVPVSVSESTIEAAAEVGYRIAEESGNLFSEIASASVTEVDLAQRLRHNEYS